MHSRFILLLVSFFPFHFPVVTFLIVDKDLVNLRAHINVNTKLHVMLQGAVSRNSEIQLTIGVINFLVQERTY